MGTIKIIITQPLPEPDIKPNVTPKTRVKISTLELILLIVAPPIDEIHEQT